MSTYTGKKAVVNRPIAEVYDRFSNLEYLRGSIDNLPEEQKAQLGQLRLENDGLVISVPQFGEVKFTVIESNAPTKVVYGADNFPLPLNIIIELDSPTADSTEVASSIDVDIPAIMKPFVGSKIQMAADHFSDLITKLNQ